MARNINGEIISDGNGTITDWKSKEEQKASYGSSVGNVTSIDIGNLIMTKPSIVQIEQGNDATLYDEKSKTTAVSGIGYTMFICSVNNTSDTTIVVEWLKANGLWFNPITDSQNISKVPFEKYFGWKYGNVSGIEEIHFSSPSTYESDYSTMNADRYYSLGIGVSVGGASPMQFSWLRDGIFFGYHSCKIDESSVRMYTIVFDDTKIKNILGTFTIEKTPEADETNGIPSLPFGGAGDIVKRKFDSITEPDTPTLGISTSGMYNVYQIYENQLSGFASQLYHTTTPTPYEGSEILEKINNTIEKLHYSVVDLVRGNLKDFVIDCHIVPVMPTTSARENIQIGGYTIDNLAHPITSDYVTINCGTIKVDSCYDGFEDYQTEYKLYLPFIGFVDLNPNYVANNYLTLKYRFNVIDGSCIAFLSSSIVPNSSNTSIVGVYNGSCCVHMPLTGADYSTIVSGMLQTAGNIATSVSTKNPLPALGGVANLAQSMNSQKFAQSNNYNASGCFMGIRKPYLLIHRPTRNLATNFWNRKGGLLNSQYKLLDLKDSGFTICENVDIMSLGNIKTNQKEQIKNALEKGVYL